MMSEPRLLGRSSAKVILTREQRERRAGARSGWGERARPLKGGRWRGEHDGLQSDREEGLADRQGDTCVTELRLRQQWAAFVFSQSSWQMRHLPGGPS